MFCFSHLRRGTLSERSGPCVDARSDRTMSAPDGVSSDAAVYAQCIGRIDRLHVAGPIHGSRCGDIVKTAISPLVHYRQADDEF